MTSSQSAHIKKTAPFPPPSRYNMSEVDSESFNSTTKWQIRTFYDNRCIFCLNKLGVEGSQCAHILGASEAVTCSKLGIIPHDYERQSQGNGIILCANCHQGLFSSDYIALCPPKKVLRYLVKYVKDTSAGNQMPLYQVLYELTTSNPQGLPDPSAILPYIGLYTIVHLKATELQDFTHCTPFFPPLSILHNGQWGNESTRTPSIAPNVARIFDSLAVNASGQRPSPGVIPLHPDHPHYPQKQYWRLPKTTLGGILSAVMWHVRANLFTADRSDELRMVELLHCLLTLKEFSVDAELTSDTGSSGEDCREDEEGRGGRGGDGRRGTPQKRAAEDEGNTNNKHSSNKRHC